MWQKETERESAAPLSREGEKPRRRTGVLETLFAYLAGFCVMVLLALWVMQIFLLDFIYEKVAVARMDRAADAVLVAMDNYDPEDVSPLREEMSGIAVAYQMTLSAFILNDGELNKLVDAGRGEAGAVLYRLSNSEIEELYEEACAAGGSTTRTYHEKYSYGTGEDAFATGQVEMRRLVYVSCREDASGRDVVLFLDVATIPPGTTQNVLRIEMVVLSLVLILSAVWLAQRMSRRIAQPIAHINETAKALAAGHYDVQFDCGGYREIEELSSTLNYAAAELSKVDSLQKELIANISHDLRTPLTMIIGYGEIIRDIEGENKPENVQVIIDEAKRLSSLVNDLLELSRYRAGCQELEKTCFDMGATLTAVGAQYNTMLANRGFHFTVQVEEGLPVCADRPRILQVIYNLTNNAVNYSGESREVALLASRTEDGRSVRVAVIDHGEGIPADKLSDIWERYYKVDAQHKRSTVGSGLGLSIVRGILELHGAHYGVDSRLGEGSRFWFELPLLEPTAPPVPERS